MKRKNKIEGSTNFYILLSEIEENTYFIERNTHILPTDKIEDFSLNIEENTYLLLPSILYKIEG